MQCLFVLISLSSVLEQMRRDYNVTLHCYIKHDRSSERHFMVFNDIVSGIQDAVFRD